MKSSNATRASSRSETTPEATVASFVTAVLHGLRHGLLDNQLVGRVRSVAWLLRRNLSCRRRFTVCIFFVGWLVARSLARVACLLSSFPSNEDPWP